MSSPKKLRIALAIPTLECGGAENVCSALATWLHRRGQQAALITFNPKEQEWPIDPHIPRLYIDDYRREYTEHSAITALKEIFAAARPDVAISFLPRMNLRVLSAAENLPVIISEHTYPPARRMADDILQGYNDVYPKARFLVVLTERARAWANEFMPPHTVRVIANPFIPRQCRADARPLPQKYVLGIGRFVAGKGFDDLIAAFAMAHASAPELALVLAGAGDQEALLKKAASASGVVEHIHFYGYSKNPENLYKNAFCFVLPSLYEGFPGTLLEAMAYGAPCIAADCAAGPSELLGLHGERGLLYPPGDVDSLARRLIKFHEDGAVRAELGKQAKEYAAQFSEDKLFAQWLDLCQIAAGQINDEQS